MQEKFSFPIFNLLHPYFFSDSKRSGRNSLLFLFLPLLLSILLMTGCGTKSSPFLAVDPEKRNHRNHQEIVKGEESRGRNVTLSIAATSDLHGYLYGYDYVKGVENKRSGLTKISTLVKELRAEDPDLLLMDLGDTIQGNRAEIFNGDLIHPMIQAMNLIEYDLWTLGNHEFNFGPDFLIRNINGFDRTVATSNILFTEGGESLLLQSQIFIIKGVRTAVVNAITSHVPHWEASSPEHFAGLTFVDPVESVKEVVRGLEGEYDLLVGGFHIGLRSAPRFDPTSVMKILEAVPEFDLVFHGHEHSRRNTVVNGIPVLEPGRFGWALSYAEVHLKREGARWVVENIETENLETENILPDPELVELFKSEHERALATIR